MNKFLFKHIDNTGLVLWRVAFGLLIAIEGYGAIATGWVRRTLIEPDFTFNFIGLDFLQPLPGDLMHWYFALMGTFGVLVMLGYKYRFSMFCYALMWSCVYLMQKTSYNNHYYLMMLLCWIMVLLPAHKWFSLDASFSKKIKSPSMPRWVSLILILQVWIVYTYASIAKWYPGWLDTSVSALFMKGKTDYWLIGPLLQLDWVHWCIAYVGILFDLLIIPLLMWRRTRIIGFWISVFFHLFNSIIFQIGIFPYMSIAFALFFFSSEILQRRFLPKKTHYNEGEIKIPAYRNALIGVMGVYFIFQILLPLRHWTYPDDVLWTEEGHRLSWRMMLRSRGSTLTVYTKEKDSTDNKKYDYKKLLSKKQKRSVKSKPDLIWQLAQRIKELEANEGRDVQVFVKSKVKINGGAYYPFIDPKVDLASEPWLYFTHHDWILPSPDDYSKKPVAMPNVQTKSKDSVR
ncbi:HTTM domain-containing protein [Patiriisocius sp. Uisw_047]|uniref:HTTM domain-containing protein n=1 Tax=Patiriisocius sp. Uisw_047 TaxID=3230969 RepID=UPI0039EB9C87